jgi:hypothetical protein
VKDLALNGIVIVVVVIVAAVLIGALVARNS